MISDHPRSVSRSFRWLLVLFGLWGFAVAQPALGLLGSNPVLVSNTNVSERSVFITAFTIALVPPVALWLLDVVVGLRFRWWQRYIVAVALTALFLGRLLTLTSVTNPFVVVIVSVAGAGVAVWFALQNEAPQRFVMLTSVLPLLALGTFWGSETVELLQAEPAEAVVLAPTEAERPTVVMLVLDEFPTMSLIAPDGAIDAERFPNLAAFVDDATWFRHFSTVSPFTSSAVPALLTGTNPTNEHALWTNFPNNLFSLLAADYHLSVAESSTKLCGFAICENGPVRAPARNDVGAEVGDDDGNVSEPAAIEDSGRFRRTLARLWWEGIVAPGGEPGLDDFLESTEPEPPSTTAAPDGPPDTATALTEDEFFVARGFASGPDTQPVRLVQLLDTMAADDAPAVYFAHILLPHRPFTFDEQGRMFVRTGEPYEPKGNETPWVSATLRQLHLQQAQYADALVGQALQRLRDEGLYDDAVIAIMADHGASFDVGTHDREYAESTLPSIAYAPFLLKAPGLGNGGIDDSNLLSVDVLPAIAAAADIEIPWDTDGGAPGSAVVADRGSEKYLYNYRDAFDPQLIEVVTFDDDVVFPSVLEGAVTGRSDADVAGAELVGQPFAPATQSATIAKVAGLDRLRAGERLGTVTGTVESGPDAAATVVVALDGLVVGVSPIAPYGALDNYFAVVIDPSIVDPLGADLRIGVRGPDGTVEELIVEAT